MVVEQADTADLMRCHPERSRRVIRIDHRAVGSGNRLRDALKLGELSVFLSLSKGDVTTPSQAPQSRVTLSGVEG